MVVGALASCSIGTESEFSGSALLVPAVRVDATIANVDASQVPSIIDIPQPDDFGLRLSSSDGLYVHTWDAVADYPDNEPLRVGAYFVETFHGEVGAEGFGCPYFYGGEAVMLSDGETESVEVVARMSNVAFEVDFSEALLRSFSDVSVVLHSKGGQYVEYRLEETRVVFMNPEPTDLILQMKTADGIVLNFKAASLEKVLPGCLYKVYFDLSESGNLDKVLTTVSDGQSVVEFTTELTAAFLSAEAPVVSAIGMPGHGAFELIEGTTPQNPVGVRLSGATASGVVLTCGAPSLVSRGCPTEIDLLSADESVLSRMKELGFEIIRNAEGGISEIYLTDVLGKLRCSQDGSKATFGIVATSPQGRMSVPLVLDFSIEPAQIRLVDISDILFGVNVARMKLLSDASDLRENLLIQTLDASNRWIDAVILDVEELPDGATAVSFQVPDGSSASVPVRATYCGNEFMNTMLRRVSPDYSLEVDPFAMLAIVKLNVSDESLLEAVTANINIFLNGEPTALLGRTPEKGYIVVGGLKDNTTYRLSASLFTGASAYENMSESVTFTTERAAALPNGGFEDVKRDALKYNSMPSGGRYSQNIVDIFNLQNYTSFDLFEPKSWAMTNKKTFNMAAKNHNTWYMQPSVYTTTESFDGAYAVVIQSVAYDLDGPEIKPYRQEGEPYVRYSRNIPEIAHRAAGKLFLGTYQFDATTQTEIYDDGITFSSRPTSLNGYYKFVPSVSNIYDQGYVEIEILGKVGGSELVIARGKRNLTATSSYAAFNVPLEYEMFGIKATKLKVLLSSSNKIGTIEEETLEVSTYSDPVTSTSIGSVLTVDGLTLSY